MKRLIITASLFASVCLSVGTAEAKKRDRCCAPVQTRCCQPVAAPAPCAVQPTCAAPAPTCCAPAPACAAPTCCSAAAPVKAAAVEAPAPAPKAEGLSKSAADVLPPKPAEKKADGK